MAMIGQQEFAEKLISFLRSLTPTEKAEMREALYAWAARKSLDQKEAR